MLALRGGPRGTPGRILTMKCPFCNRPDSRVVDSRGSSEGFVIRRRRECDGCGARFTTYERVEHAPLRVLKRDGRREDFDRDKLRRSLEVACRKRPVPTEAIENAVSLVEHEVSRTFGREIESGRLGEIVMRELRKLDEVAYVRFASVYRAFDDVGEFADEAKRVETGRRDEAIRRRSGDLFEGPK
jgi:transcriptional repressor NrdR